MANKPGRPTKYTKDIGAKLVDLMSTGMSKTQAAVELGVTRETFWNWQKVHPEFLDAVKEGEFASQAWWEKAGQSGMHMGKDFNATTWIFNMKNRFPSEWRDKQEVSQESHVFTKVEFVNGDWLDGGDE